VKKATVAWVTVGLIVIAGLVCAAVLADRSHHVEQDEPLTFDEQGKAHGTGDVTYKYESRAPKLVSHIVRGKQVRSEWFRPDGTSILVTEWKDGSGVGLYVREDGSIMARMTYVHEVADGPATYYAPDGTVLGEGVFKDGKRVSGYEPPDESSNQKGK
jgi:antitoxin component YwqK of YwqJK toxin-antitoxin module